MLNENLNAVQTGHEEELFIFNRYSAENLAKLTDEELMDTIYHSNWNKMNEAARLRVYQEFENRQAKLDGRKPVQIRADREMEPNLYGIHISYPDGSEIIYINPRFIKISKLSKGANTAIFNAASGLNTVLHEGRHSFQHNVIKNNSNMVSELQKLEWKVSMGEFGGLYLRHSIFYAMQGIEMDARRFARRQIVRINEHFKASGKEDPNFNNCVRQDLQDEKDYIMEVRLFLKMEDIVKTEKRVLDYFKEKHPDVKLDHLNIFYHAKLILMYPQITNPQDMLDLIDNYLDGKLGQLDARMDQMFAEDINTVREQVDNLPMDRVP